MLTQEILKEHLSYDLSTGIFTWIKPNARRVKIGDTVKSLSHGYVRVVLFSKYYQAHRLAWFYMTGKWPLQIDHIDNNRSNNRWDNLREGDQSENMCNIRRPINNKSGIKGIYWDSKRNKWSAQIQFKGKCVYSKRFDNLIDAENNIKIARQLLHNEYTNHG